MSLSSSSDGGYHEVMYELNHLLVVLVPIGR